MLMRYPLHLAHRRLARIALRPLRPLSEMLNALGTAGVSTIEFALVLPVLLTLMLYGTELAYMASVSMQVSQLAASVADNASRLGQTDNSSVSPTVSEADVDTIMAGARSQGKSLNIAGQGRVILTSLEVHPGDNKQWIHWQRCTGSLPHQSAYGNDSTANGVNGPEINGMGQHTLISAQPGSAVMYVEVYYQHHGLFGTTFVGTPVFRQEAAFEVRDGRNLLQSAAKGLSGTSIGSPCT
jgi:hypothetical protein